MRRSMLAGIWLVALVLAITVTWQIVSAADDRVSERPIAPLNVAPPVNTGPTTSSTASTTSPASSSTTLSSGPTTEAIWLTRSVQTPGGNVVLRYRPGEVAYQSATPAPGFKVEVEKQGPPQVRVEFESESHRVEVEAAWEDGDLDVSVSEERED